MSEAKLYALILWELWLLVRSGKTPAEIKKEISPAFRDLRKAKNSDERLSALNRLNTIFGKLQ